MWPMVTRGRADPSTSAGETKCSVADWAVSPFLRVSGEPRQAERQKEGMKPRF